MRYILYSDPAHAWLKVPMNDIRKLGLADKISSYSYRYQQYAYLEEDCDAMIFIKALKEKGLPFSYKQINSRSNIRNYPRYTSS